MTEHRDQIDTVQFVVRGATRRTMPRRDSDGLCYRAPVGEPYDLFVRVDMSDRKVAELIAHEVLHVADWHKDEAWVDATAQAISRALMAFGFHR